MRLNQSLNTQNTTTMSNLHLSIQELFCKFTNEQNAAEIADDLIFLPYNNATTFIADIADYLMSFTPSSKEAFEIAINWHNQEFGF